MVIEELYELCELYEVIILLKLLLPQFAEIGTDHFSRRGIPCSCRK